VKRGGSGPGHEKKRWKSYNEKNESLPLTREKVVVEKKAVTKHWVEGPAQNAEPINNLRGVTSSLDRLGPKGNKGEEKGDMHRGKTATGIRASGEATGRRSTQGGTTQNGRERPRKNVKKRSWRDGKKQEETNGGLVTIRKDRQPTGKQKKTT